MVFILLIVLLIVGLGGGGWGYSRYGAVGMSPAAVILIVLGILYFTGRLR
jgi:hypothetical protein